MAVIKNLQLHIEDYYLESLKDKDLDIPYEKSWKLIKDRNKGREDLIAFSEGDHKITYGEMFKDWEDTAKVFSYLGINRDNNAKVLVIMPNVAKTGSFDYAADMTGAPVSFIDPTTPLDKIEQYIKDEGITDVVVSDLLFLQNMGKIFTKMKEKLGLKNIILYKDAYLYSLMPNKIRLVGTIANAVNRFSPDIIRYEDAVRKSKDGQITYDTKGPEEVNLITHTSGTTTGLGKPIPITDVNRNALNKNYELTNFKYEPGMKMMHFIPYFAGYGSVNTAHLGLSQGFELQEIPLFSPNKFGEYLTNLKSEIVIAIPSCWLGLINDPKYKDIDLSFLVYPVVGGAPMSVEEEHKINEFLLSHGSNVVLTKGYGLSELGGCAITSFDGFNPIGSVGVRQPLIDVKLIDDNDRVLGDREVGEGEVYIHSATMTPGYFNGKDIIKRRIIDGKEYLKTGDILRRDEFGRYYYVDRKDRMFNRYDGYNVYSLNVEKLFLDYDEIDNAVMCSERVEELHGNVPKIYIQLSKEHEFVDREKLIKDIINNSFLSNRKRHTEYVGNYREIPRKFIFVDDIPKNTMGKNAYGLIEKNGLDGDSYSIIVDEDNMSLKSFEVVEDNKVKNK